MTQALRDCDELLKLTAEENAAFSQIRDYRSQLQNLDSQEDTAVLKKLTDEVIHYKQERFSGIQGELAQLKIQLDQNCTEMEKCGKKLGKLKRKKLTYPVGVELLVETLQEDFTQIGREVQPGILCEMLEIQDEEWRDAVEGYLNTQRFYVLVKPEDFDLALGTYDRLRREKKVYSVGLINTKDLEKYDTAPEGTLASVVTSRNPYARQYSNMILGKVQLCERYEDLKKYPNSITKGCMRYQNRVASAIKPEVYKVPFIGKNAFKVQLIQAEEEYGKLEELLEKQEKKLADQKKILELLSTDCDVDIKYRLDVTSTLKNVKASMEKCEENILKLQENSTLIQKQFQLDELEKVLKGLEMTISSEDRKIGDISGRIRELIARKQSLQENLVRRKEELILMGASLGELLNLWNREYEKLPKMEDVQRIQNFQNEYQRKKENNSRYSEKQKENMREAMIQYKTEHDFGAAANMEGFPEFEAVYERLKNSELLDYEEKVQFAREAAETEFREQFLAKLQENMKQAQGEFRELNRALGDIDFSSERYEFLFMPSKKYRNYYEMIMDDFNVIQGESLFSGTFHETHKAVIDELFERLSIGGENSTQALEEFTDYRTYMDYDIKILHSDGTFSYYSKVCEEKSGGETQTPFYVTVAASFVQLYSNNIGGEAAGLVLFDEAFNNMDDERIGGVLEFLRRLPLQLIIAAPPDKIQYIGPAMDEILLVMTDQKRSYVEEYHNAVI